MPVFTARVPVLLAVFVVVAGCAGAEVERATDPLVGRIFFASGEELPREALLDRVAAADVVYLGELHDSEHHHQIQRETLEHLVAAGLRPALGLEMFSREQTALLMQYVDWDGPHGEHGPRTAEEWLQDQLGWSEGSRGWWKWQAYGGLLQGARAHGLAVFGADLSTALASRITRAGVDGLSAAERALWQPTGFEDAAYESLMRERIRGAHCGHGSDEFLARLYQAWVARNDAMARSIVAAAAGRRESGPVLMVVGSGHLEHGMGIAERVAAIAPHLRQLSIAMLELAAPAQPLAAYLTPVTHAGRDFGPRHQVVWFTAAREEAVDHCAAFAHS